MGLRKEEIRFLNQAIEEIKREVATLPDEALGAKRPEINSFEDAFAFLIGCADMIIKKKKIDKLFGELNNLLGGSHDAEKNEEE